MLQRVGAAAAAAVDALGTQRRFCRAWEVHQRKLNRMSPSRMLNDTGRGSKLEGSYSHRGTAPVAVRADLQATMAAFTGNLSNKQWERKERTMPSYARNGRLMGQELRVPVPGTLRDSERFNPNIDETLTRPGLRMSRQERSEVLSRERGEARRVQKQRIYKDLQRAKMRQEKLLGHDVDDVVEQTWRPGDVNYSKKGRSNPLMRYHPLRDAPSAPAVGTASRSHSASAAEAYHGGRSAQGAVPNTYRAALIDNVSIDVGAMEDRMDGGDTQFAQMHRPFNVVDNKPSQHIIVDNKDARVQSKLGRLWNYDVAGKERRRHVENLPDMAVPAPYEAGPRVLKKEGKIQDVDMWKTRGMANRTPLALRHYKPVYNSPEAGNINKQFKPWRRE